MSSERERAEEIAHGGLASRDGDLVTLGDGARWWLNGTPDSRAEADAEIVLAARAERLRELPIIASRGRITFQ